MNQVNKQHELTINISPGSRSNMVTNTTFFSMDVKTAKKIINFVQNNNPVDLTDATVMLGFEFVGAGASKIIDSKDGSVVIENAEAGVCSVVLPNHLYDYEGQVLVHVYIIYQDGRSLDCGIIVTEFEESWLDRELPQMSDFYVKRFEDLAQEVQNRADELKEILKNAGSGNTCLCPTEFDLSLLAGSGLLQIKEVDVSQQIRKRLTTPFEITSSGEEWHLWHQNHHHEVKYLGGIELRSDQVKNLATIKHHCPRTGHPTAVPVNLAHTPPLHLSVMTWGEVGNWDTLRHEEIIVENYKVEPFTTKDGLETYLLSGDIEAPFHNEETTTVAFKMVIGGLMNYDDPSQVLSISPTDSFVTSSIVCSTTTDLTDKIISIDMGYFATEYKEWTTKVQKITELIHIDSQFETGERLDFDITYDVDADFYHYWGAPIEANHVKMTIKVRDARIGERISAKKYVTGHPDIIGETTHWDDVYVTVKPDGIYLEEFRNKFVDWWGVPAEKTTPKLEWLEVTRRL